MLGFIGLRISSRNIIKGCNFTVNVKGVAISAIYR